MNDFDPSSGEFSPPAAELLALADLVLDGVELNSGQRFRLNALLLESPALRRLYVGYTGVAASLVLRAAEHQGADEAHTDLERETLVEVDFAGSANQSTAQTNRSSLFSRSLGFAAAACLAVGVAGATLKFFFAEINDSPRVTLVDTKNAQWEVIPDDGTPPQTIVVEKDRFLPSESPLRIASGYAELAFPNGATMQVKGPTSLRILSEMRVELLSGIVAANVPPSAKGFTVVLPETDVVDIGTGFGIELNANGVSEVHVLDGLVEVSESIASEEAAIPLKEGEALRIPPLEGQPLSNVAVRFPADPGRFSLSDSSSEPDGTILEIERPLPYVDTFEVSEVSADINGEIESRLGIDLKTSRLANSNIYSTSSKTAIELDGKQLLFKPTPEVLSKEAREPAYLSISVNNSFQTAELGQTYRIDLEMELPKNSKDQKHDRWVGLSWEDKSLPIFIGHPNARVGFRAVATDSDPSFAFYTGATNVTVDDAYNSISPDDPFRVSLLIRETGSPEGNSSEMIALINGHPTTKRTEVSLEGTDRWFHILASGSNSDSEPHTIKAIGVTPIAAEEWDKFGALADSL